MKANRTVRDFEVALMNLLLTTSFERITVDQICDEALLHRSSFYRYFHDKYDLLEQALGAWVERIVDQTATEDDLIEALVSQIEANRAMFSNLANGGMRSSFSAELVRMIAEILLARRQSPSQNTIVVALKKANNPEMLAYVLSGAIMGTFYWWQENNYHVPKAEVVTFIKRSVHALVQ